MSQKFRQQNAQTVDFLNGLATTAILADGYNVKKLSDIARDALELPPAQRLTLARILLDLSESDRKALIAFLRTL